MITIRVLDQNRAAWRRVAYRHRRPLETVIMVEKRKEELLEDAREFLLSESWYNQRGISWKRGYLLNGPVSLRSASICCLRLLSIWAEHSLELERAAPVSLRCKHVLAE
jgi:chaperone BCS1